MFPILLDVVMAFILNVPTFPLGEYLEQIDIDWVQLKLNLKNWTISQRDVLLKRAAGTVNSIATGFINFIGRSITLSIPYWVGRFSGSDLISNLQEQYPKLKEICDRQEQSPVFISFLLRTFCFLPGDAVSLYLGATRIPFPYYLTGGVLGTSLGVVLATILGSSITEPGSLTFWLSASLMAFIAVISVIFYLRNSKKKVKEKQSS